MRTSISKIEECFLFWIFVWVMFRGKDNFEQLSKNVKYVNLKKNMVIYHKEGKGLIIGLF